MAAARRAREQQLEQPAASAGDASRNVEERLLVLEKSVDSIFDALNKALLQQVTIIKDCHKAVLGEWRKALVASLPAAQALPAPAVPEPVLPVTAEPSSWPTQESGGQEEYEGTEASNEAQEGTRVLRKRTRKRRVSRPAKRAHLREESMGEEEAQRPPEAATAPAQSLQADAPQQAAAGSPATSSTASVRPIAPSASATSPLACGAAVHTGAILPETALDAPAAKEEMGPAAAAEDAAAAMGQHSRRPKRRKKALLPSDSDVPTPPSSVGPASQQLPAASQPVPAESEPAACSGVPCAEPLQSRPSASETEVLAPPRSVGPGGRDLPTAATPEQPSRASGGTPPVAGAEPEELLADQVSAEAREGEEEGEEEAKEEVDEEVEEEMPRPSVVAPLPEPSEKERASPPKWMQPLQLDPNSYHSEDELRWEWYKSGRAVTFPEWCSQSELACCHPAGQKKHGCSKTRGLATANPEVDQSPLFDQSPAQPPQSLQADSEHQDAAEEPATTAGASPQQQEPPSRHPSSPSSAAGLPEPAAEAEQQAAETSAPELPAASECSQEDSLAPPDASPQVPPQGSRGRRRAGKHREASPELPTLRSTPEPSQPPVLAAEAVEMADNTSSPGNPAENAPSDNDCTPELDALAESFLDDLADIDEGKPTATCQPDMAAPDMAAPDMAVPDMAEALLDDLAGDLDAEPSRPEEAPGDSQPLDSWSPDLTISGSPGASSPKGTDPDQPTICNPASQKRLPGASSQTPQKRSAQKRPGKRKRASLEKEEEEEQPAGTQGPAAASAAGQAAASPSFPSASFPSACSASADPVQGAVEQQSHDVPLGDVVDVPSKDCSVDTEPSLVPAAEAGGKLHSFIQQPVELHPKTFYSEDELHWEWYKSGRQQSFPEWFQSHPCKSPWGGGLHAAKKAVNGTPQDEAEAGTVIATSPATDAEPPPTPPPPPPTSPTPSASKEASTPVVPPPPTPPAPNQVPDSKSPRLAQSPPPAPASRAPQPLATSAPSGSQMPETAAQLERATGAQHAAYGSGPADSPAPDVGLETMSTGKKKKQEWFQQRYAQARSQVGERPAPKQLPRKRPTSRHGEKLQGGEDRWPDFPPLPRSQSPPSAPRPAPSEVSHQPLVPVDDVLPPLM